ncbi:hypothetical protein JL720_15906 [Aureococcus anophagefferens]|nr:hypothetical protein JL720_15906 [Aureococcus anophagefferens]
MQRLSQASTLGAADLARRRVAVRVTSSSARRSGRRVRTPPRGAIDGKEFAGIEAVGKNLFAWFGSGADEVCVHVHFGMAGNWAVFDAGEPETTATTRPAGHGVVSHLSAMTVAHGTRDGLYAEKRRKLGEDPLRDDADPERLWGKVAASKKSIGALVMDQSCFTGPGNIYRAEILFKAGVHPDRPGNSLSRDECDPASATGMLFQRDAEKNSGHALSRDARREELRPRRPR